MAAKNASGFLKTLLLTFLTRPNAQGYDSLVNERQLAMKYHGLDVESKE